MYPRLSYLINMLGKNSALVECTAIVDFKKYLKARLLGPVTTFEVDINLLLAALAMEDDHVKNAKNFGGYYDRKSYLVFDEVIGPIENILSVCSQMAIAQGVTYQQESGEAFRRSSKLSWCNSSIAKFLCGSGRVDETGRGDRGGRLGAGRSLSKFFSDKNKLCAELHYLTTYRSIGNNQSDKG